MTPKKIYISERDRRNAEESDLIIAHKTSTVIKELGGKLAYNYEEVYILESEHKRIIDELKKHMGLLLASMDGQLDEYRLEYGESYPENPISVNAKQFLKSIQ